MFGFKPVVSVATEALPQLLRQKGALLLDVREPAEYQAGHIPYARNVPLSQIRTYTPPANAKLYVICRSGARSKRAYKQLRRRGLDVTNVQGGMLAWKGPVN